MVYPTATSGMARTVPLASFSHPTPIRVFTQSQLRQSVTLVLHTILFQRVYGTLRPASVPYLHIEFPIVIDESIIRLVRRKSQDLAEMICTAKSSSIDSGESPTGDVILSIYDSGASSVEPVNTPHPTWQQRQEKQFETGENYKHGWLAHAFAGGIGGPSMDSRPAQLGDCKDRESAGGGQRASSSASHDTEAVPVPATIVPDLGTFKEVNAYSQVLETWRVSFKLVSKQSGAEGHYKSTSSDDVAASGHERVEEQLVDFLEQAMRFVDEERNHLPPLPSSDLCPFPVAIQVSQR